MKTIINKTTALALVFSALLAGPVTAAAQSDKAVVLRPHSGAANLYGKTYGEWSAEHWKWTFSMPPDSHPLYDTADISAGQSGDVWFLGGTFSLNPSQDGQTVIGKAVRRGTIPFGKALFFSLVNAEGSTFEGNGTTDAELRDAAEGLVNGHAAGLMCEIDGRPVKDLERHLVGSPQFTIGPLPANNILGNPALAGMTSPAVSSGYFVMVAPLSRGEHTIRYKGKLVFDQARDGFDFVFALDITYHLTVE